MGAPPRLADRTGPRSRSRRRGSPGHAAQHLSRHLPSGAAEGECKDHDVVEGADDGQEFWDQVDYPEPRNQYCDLGAA
jgi:hypothetical protein